MPKYKCTYDCKRQGDDSGAVVPYSIITESPCNGAFTPPSSTGLTSCVLVGSDQVPEEGTGKKVAHAVLGAAIGVAAVAVTVGTGGVPLAIGAAIGAVAGWFS
jgi:hypothetical protein